MPTHDWKIAFENGSLGIYIDNTPQMHVFWDGTRFWLFFDYYDGTSVKTAYISTTDGVNFTTPTFHVSGQSNTKIWWDGTYFYTVWSTTSGWPYWLKFSRGTRDGANIVWSGPYDVAKTIAVGAVFADCCIMADAEGYPIIGYAGRDDTVQGILKGYVQYGSKNDGTWEYDDYEQPPPPGGRYNKKMDLGARIWPFAVEIISGTVYVIARDGYSMNNGNAVPLRAYVFCEGPAGSYVASGFNVHCNWIMRLVRGSRLEVVYYNTTFGGYSGDYLPRYTFFDVESGAWQTQQQLSDVPVSQSTTSTYNPYCQLSLLKNNVLRFAWAKSAIDTSYTIWYTHVRYGKPVGVTETLTLPFYVDDGVASLYDAQDGYPMLVVNTSAVTPRRLYFSSGDWDYP